MLGTSLDGLKMKIILYLNEHIFEYTKEFFNLSNVVGLFISFGFSLLTLAHIKKDYCPNHQDTVTGQIIVVQT